MTQILPLDKWDDQELHTLFAARLPVLPLPGEFAEQLTQVVLDEISRHVDTEQELTSSFSAKHRGHIPSRS